MQDNDLKDLEEYVKHNGKLVFKEDELKTFLKNFLNIISTLHYANIYHWDLKPQIVLCCSETKELVVIDFDKSNSEKKM